MNLSQKEKEIILDCELFSSLDDEALSDALEFFEAAAKEYRKNECICHVGDHLQGFGLVLRGVVQVFTEDINGQRVIMANVSSGSTFAESLCFLEESSSPVCIFAAADCKILWLKCRNLKKGCSELTNRFISMLARRTLSMNDRIQILSKLTLREKLLTYLSQCAKEAGSRTFSIPLDRESLSLYLGVNRSALSRELSALQRDGIIEFYKNSFKIL